MASLSTTDSVVDRSLTTDHSVSRCSGPPIAAGQRASVRRAEPDPSSKLTLSADIFGVNPKPPLHCSTAHLHGISARRRDELVGRRRVDADKNATLAACRNRHVSPNEECEPAEHLLLSQVGFAANFFAYANCEVFVVRHRNNGTTGRPRASPAGLVTFSRQTRHPKARKVIAAPRRCTARSRLLPSTASAARPLREPRRKVAGAATPGRGEDSTKGINRIRRRSTSQQCPSFIEQRSCHAFLVSMPRLEMNALACQLLGHVGQEAFPGPICSQSNHLFTA